VPPTPQLLLEEALLVDLRLVVVVRRRVPVEVLRVRLPLVVDPLPMARWTRRWMLRRPRSTPLPASAEPFAVRRSTCRRSFRFSLINWSIIWFRFSTSSGPATRRRRVPVAPRVLVALAVRVRRRRVAGALVSLLVSSAMLPLHRKRVVGDLRDCLAGSITSEKSGSRCDCLAKETLQAFARQLVRRIGLPAHVADHSMAAPAAFANFGDRRSKAVTRRHPAPDHGSAIRPHDDSVAGPTGGSQLQRPRADVRLQLGGPAGMGESEGFGVDRTSADEHGDAAAGASAPVEGGVHVHHQALAQLPSLRC
jgi:hypothetical protein